MSVRFLTRRSQESGGQGRQWNETGMLQSQGKEQWCEEPDLLDSLIQQEQEERAQNSPFVLPSLETLLKLLELQSASEQSEVQGRAITGGRDSVAMSQSGLQEEQVTHSYSQRKIFKNMQI